MVMETVIVPRYEKDTAFLRDQAAALDFVQDEISNALSRIKSRSEKTISQVMR
jgi:hypothetical protein